MGGVLKNCVGMFCLWMVMGIWHGGYRYIIGVSLWYWCIMMIGNVSVTLVDKVIQKFQVKVESFSWHLFQSIRTYIIYAIGATFFVSGIRGGLHVLKDCIKVLVVKDYANPWILFDDSILALGITYYDMNIIIVGIILLIIVGTLREKYGYARVWMASQNVGFRWFTWIALFTIIIVFGIYGPGYDASIFIYQNF